MKDDSEDYPPGAEGLKKVVAEAREKIADLDRQIADLAKDRGYTPGLNPPGNFSTRKPGAYEYNLEKLINEREAVIGSSQDKIAELTSKGDPLQNLKNRDLARSDLFAPETPERIKAWKINKSQDTMDKLISESKDRPDKSLPEVDLPSSPKEESTFAKSPESTEAKTSLFSSRLSFKYFENAKDITEVRGPGGDKEDLLPEKD